MYAKILICNRSLEYYNVLLMSVIREGRGKNFRQISVERGYWIYLFIFMA